ncbi:MULTISPECIES: hypothetical protein [Carboxydocella]|uniref:Uncharacterized protein n=2 Tax=Carboxydocella TaxID=178898 RepID=A0A1T4S736_9FIRM|nr:MULTISPECIES: hypothetical protein [Carboxydocella]AVX21844.1 hypothetical protein CFE_2703 [Carboxydocella thermautotrophica]AVX32243.1 hypothetical protein CTH_2710 [Carboxydocella thermautotrophica]GAW32798.1 hypothetical protein JDF658_25630 [Carboxydocella sp. JDF658]SKA23661.1 hypothetical protein SAMN02745885_02464 [Carboxydocella sporoproducens DSM 16521]
MPIKGDYKQYTDPEEQAKMMGNFLGSFLNSSKIPIGLKWLGWFLLLCSSIFFPFVIIKDLLSGGLEIFLLVPVLFQWVLVYYILKKLLR